MKKIIYFITLLFLVGCVDLSENMYNDLGKDNYYQTEQEYDAAFMNQYAFLRTMYAWNVFYLQEITTDEACLPQKGRDGYDGPTYALAHMDRPGCHYQRSMAGTVQSGGFLQSGAE